MEGAFALSWILGRKDAGNKMKINLNVAATFLGMAVLAACVPSEGEWNTARTLAQGSPAAYREMIRVCTKTAEGKSAAAKKDMALVMNVSAADAPRIYCQRVVRAFASGRFTYAEAERLAMRRGDRSEFIRIVQGRP